MCKLQNDSLMTFMCKVQNLHTGCKVVWLIYFTAFGVQSRDQSNPQSNSPSHPLNNITWACLMFALPLKAL